MGQVMLNLPEDLFMMSGIIQFMKKVITRLEGFSEERCPVHETGRQVTVLNNPGEVCPEKDGRSI